MLLRKNGFLDIYFMKLLVYVSILNLEHYRTYIFRTISKHQKWHYVYIKVRINLLKITIIVMEIIWNLITNNY